jgi:hypothetical protein
VQIVDQQQACHLGILGEAGGDLLAGLPVGGEGAEDLLQARALHLDDRRHELLGHLSGGRVARSVELRLQFLHTSDQVLGGHRADAASLRGSRLSRHRYLYAIAVGVCWTFVTLPPPVYMCTPHGRQGSNERTARMMSTPLNLSGPFSSKIGVFCTASS